MRHVSTRVGAISRRAGWNVVDQILSALSNVLLSLLVARTVDAHAFGAFSIAFLVFSLVLAVNRAAVGQPLQITFAAAAPAEFRNAARLALGAATMGGTATGLVAVVTGVLLGGDPGHALIALGVCLPGLLLQDTARMVFFSQGRAKLAALNDGCWAVLAFGALAVALILSVHNVWLPILIWGGSAAIAAMIAMAQLRLLPALRGAFGWAVGQGHLTGYLLAEYVLGQGLAQVGILLVGILGSAEGVGALRAAQVLLGPLGIIGTAAFMFAIPEMARRPDMRARDRMVFCVVISAAMGFATVLFAPVLLLLPDHVGQQILGDTWVGAQSVLLPMCVLSLSAALATGPAATLYGLGQARTTFGVNIIKAPLLLVLMLGGIAWFGAVGAAWAIALTETVLLPLWFLRVRRALRPASSVASPPQLDLTTQPS